jgi:hypothetical protein
MIPSFNQGDRILWNGKKAVVKRLWKTKAKITLSDLTEETVPISELVPWIESNEQLCLIDTSQFEDKRSFTDWELENQDVIETPPKVSITESVIETENVIETIETNEYEALSIADLISLKQKIERELADRSESSIKNLIELHKKKDVIENLPSVSITEGVIENQDVIENLPSVSITEGVIENQDVIENLPSVSITEGVIETEKLGFNPYWVQRNGKKYEYWRYTYRLKSGIKHIHIGKIDRVNQLRGKNRQEILSLLGKKSC